MKKIISFVFLCFFCFSAAFADAPVFVVSGTAEEFEVAGSKVFVFNSLTGAEITLIADAKIDTAVCRTYIANPNTATDLPETAFSVDTVAGKITISELTDATGYIFLINETTYIYIYVFDYNNYVPKINALDVEGDCFGTDVKANLSMQAMNYYMPAAGTLYRYFTLEYKTLRWNDDAEKFEEVETTESIPPLKSGGEYIWPLEDSVFINTTFTLTNTDQYTKAFGEVKMESEEFTAQKPIIKAIGELTPRTADNERDKGDDKLRDNLEGSAPVEVNLRVHANTSSEYNTSLEHYFTWYIYEETQPDVPIHHRSYPSSSDPNFNIKFSTYGKYVARVTTTTADGCTAVDSINIEVIGSEIDIPNVFTPNGDGKNDKFCVAFKSIIKYNMWIYNRWGRLVFSSNNPENCWDGYIGNQKAAVGAYFYKIEATGADGKKYKRAGDINLLR